MTVLLSCVLYSPFELTLRQELGPVRYEIPSRPPVIRSSTGCLGLVHWDDPEGWNGEGGGRRVQDGEHM